MERNKIKSLIQEKLAALKSIVLERCPGQPIEAIVISGDFATGELCVIKESGHPIYVSKCRVTVIMSSPLDTDFKNRVAKQLSDPLPDVLLVPSVLDIFDLPLLPASPWVLELKRDGRVIHGNSGILSRIRHFEESDIPLTHCFQHVLLAIPELLRDFPPLHSDNAPCLIDRLRLMYGCTEALFTCCEALLLLRRCVASGIRRKRSCFAREYGDEISLQKLFNEAMTYRIETYSMLNANPTEYWFKAKDTVLDILVRYFAHFCCCDSANGDLSEICFFIANLFSLDGKGKYLSACIELLQSIAKEKIDEYMLHRLMQRLVLPDTGKAPQKAWEAAKRAVLEKLDRLNAFPHVAALARNVPRLSYVWS